jgi:hypothetical protein
VRVEGIGLRFLDDALSWRVLPATDSEIRLNPVRMIRKLDG